MKKPAENSERETFVIMNFLAFRLHSPFPN